MANAQDLNTRQLRFALGVAEGKTATQAAIDAGYKPKYAARNADKLRKNTKIAKYIREMRGDLQESTKITAELVVNELALIGLASGQNAWARFKMDMKMTDKIRALELLGKHLGIFEGADKSDKTLLEAMHERMLKEAGEYDGGSAEPDS